MGNGAGAARGAAPGGPGPPLPRSSSAPILSEPGPERRSSIIKSGRRGSALNVSVKPDPSGSFGDEPVAINSRRSRKSVQLGDLPKGAGAGESSSEFGGRTSRQQQRKSFTAAMFESLGSLMLGAGRRSQIAPEQQQSKSPAEQALQILRTLGTAAPWTAPAVRLSMLQTLLGLALQNAFGEQELEMPEAAAGVRALVALSSADGSDGPGASADVEEQRSLALTILRLLTSRADMAEAVMQSLRLRNVMDLGNGAAVESDARIAVAVVRNLAATHAFEKEFTASKQAARQLVEELSYAASRGSLWLAPPVLADVIFSASDEGMQQVVRHGGLRPLVRLVEHDSPLVREAAAAAIAAVADSEHARETGCQRELARAASGLLSALATAEAVDADSEEVAAMMRALLALARRGIHRAAAGRILADAGEALGCLRRLRDGLADDEAADMAAELVVLFEDDGRLADAMARPAEPAPPASDTATPDASRRRLRGLRGGGEEEEGEGEGLSASLDPGGGAGVGEPARSSLRRESVNSERGGRRRTSLAWDSSLVRESPPPPSPPPEASGRARRKSVVQRFTEKMRGAEEARSGSSSPLPTGRSRSRSVVGRALEGFAAMFSTASRSPSPAPAPAPATATARRHAPLSHSSSAAEARHSPPPAVRAPAALHRTQSAPTEPPTPQSARYLAPDSPGTARRAPSASSGRHTAAASTARHTARASGASADSVQLAPAGGAGAGGVLADGDSGTSGASVSSEGAPPRRPTAAHEGATAATPRESARRPRIAEAIGAGAALARHGSLQDLIASAEAALKGGEPPGPEPPLPGSVRGKAEGHTALVIDLAGSPLPGASARAGPGSPAAGALQLALELKAHVARRSAPLDALIDRVLARDAAVA